MKTLSRPLFSSLVTIDTSQANGITHAPFMHVQPNRKKFQAMADFLNTVYDTDQFVLTQPTEQQNTYQMQIPNSPGCQGTPPTVNFIKQTMSQLFAVPPYDIKCDYHYKR